MKDDLPALPRIAPGVYRHYKGGLYMLLTTGYDSETTEPVCVYVSLLNGVIWTRPAAMWNEIVNGVRRFLYLGETV